MGLPTPLLEVCAEILKTLANYGLPGALAAAVIVALLLLAYLAFDKGLDVKIKMGNKR